MVFDPLSVFEEDDGDPFGNRSEPSADLEEAVGSIPRETLYAFVAAVFFAHIGLFAASLGLMLVYFRGQWAVGVALFLGGTVALLATFVTYRWHESVSKEREQDERE